MSGQLAEVVAAVGARVPYLRCTTLAPPDQGWIGCAELIADADRLQAEIAATAAGRGTGDPAVATSLYAQAYAFRVPSIAVAAYALGLPVPTLAPGALAIRIARNRPAELAVLEPECGPPSADRLAHELFAGHLVGFVEAVRARTRIGERLLWGNVAASLATIFRAVESGSPAGCGGDLDVRRRAEAFGSAAEPWIGGLGGYSTLAAGEAQGWYWDRHNCCLWYQTSSGSYCDDCSLLDPADRTAARLAALAPVEGGAA